MNNPFKITREQIMEAMDAMPEDQRGPWQHMLDQMQRRDALIAELVASADYHKALGFFGSEERAAALVEWGDRLSNDTVRELLTEWWSTTEAWSGDPVLREGMLGLLRRVAPLYVNSEGHDFAWLMKTPGDTLTIYRGTLGDDPTLGHSWTTDRDVAERFALMAKSPRGMFLGMYREDGVPTIWRGRVKRDKILGYFDDRDEAEVVVDGSDVYDIEKVAEAVRT